ncbi:MAG: hypothetical protein BWX68_02908 [Verrucomicrobia bacterium ADurb.Bin063]|nr:MAG: hypothetical protein BWX68_02908 [Verrucomicrobia bacterium ADurb.Bin063]
MVPLLVTAPVIQPVPANVAPLFTTTLLLPFSAPVRINFPSLTRVRPVKVLVEATVQVPASVFSNINRLAVDASLSALFQTPSAEPRRKNWHNGPFWLLTNPPLTMSKPASDPTAQQVAPARVMGPLNVLVPAW